MKTLQEKIDSLREDLIEAITERVKDMGGTVSLEVLDYRMEMTGFYRLIRAEVSSGTDYLYIITHQCDGLGSPDSDAEDDSKQAEEMTLDTLYDIAAILNILD